MKGHVPPYADAGPISLDYANRTLLPAKTRAFIDFILSLPEGPFGRAFCWEPWLASCLWQSKKLHLLREPRECLPAGRDGFGLRLFPERIGHQERNAKISARCMDAADAIDVGADQREIEASAGTDIAVADLAMVQGNTDADSNLAELEPIDLSQNVLSAINADVLLGWSRWSASPATSNASLRGNSTIVLL
ncbi:hypothetical protein SAMN05216228_1007110 [Rhizobium tibeticum]|uniref:Uncharacterized protein n=1 Tax=Rhizobium tibeticum TaxID=501024 RepID=A0A1H8J4W2_9HYPH|nr:hypothetical protein RTCCBAU85039_2116 [Rhizobium tibeticum]SEN75890.1 hypothetical protein SAMN05216228_1007110 [Rhizobium tibeticum]